MTINVLHNEQANTLSVRLFNPDIVEGIYTVDRLLFGPVCAVFVKGILVEYIIHNYDRNIHLNKIWSGRLGKSFLAITVEANIEIAKAAVLSF